MNQNEAPDKRSENLSGKTPDKLSENLSGKTPDGLTGEAAESLLDEARCEINGIDREMAELFCRRMAAVRKVAQYKAAHGLPITDRAREEEVIRRNAALIGDEAIRPDYIAFLRETMEVSKEYQRRLLAAEGSAAGGTPGRWETVMRLREESYPITVERGALARAGEYFAPDRKALIVTDSGVPEEYAKRVAAGCREAHLVSIPEGEASKSPETLFLLIDAMMQNSFTRGDCAIAVGGGVVGDLTGFAASCYMRGIDFYNIPTTLLSQVDSSIGGKTAIDYGGIKNIVGAFYQPKGVLIDPDVLKTLPARQIAAGLAEAIKMAVCFDRELFEKIETSDTETILDEIIIGSLRIKQAVVEKDAKEAGLRRALNFGHTIGHGIEAERGGKLLHGECVALGMLPMCGGEVRRRLLRIYEKVGLPCRYDGDVSRAIAAATHDKKAEDGGIRVITVERVGEFEMKRETLAGLESRARAVWGN